nr:immunoglobulin heavy chain junction region [Macaca mulatta]
CVRWQSGFDYW